MARRANISDDQDQVDDYGRLVNDEAMDEQNDVLDDDDEEDEEGQDEYEKDGFLVDDVEEEEEEEEEEEYSDKEKHKKKKKKRREERNFDLDEDDYEIIGANTQSRQKFKRLKKVGRDSGVAEQRVVHSGFSDEEEREDLDGDDVDDEMADFIVNGEEIDGAHLRWKKKNNKSSSALKELYSIFGCDDEHLRRRKQVLIQSEWKERRLEDEYEPFILTEKYMTEKDDMIREADLPERMKISEDITGPPPDEEEYIEEESLWILNQFPTNMIPWWFLERVTSRTNEEREGSNEGTDEGVHMSEEKSREDIMKDKFRDDIMRFLRLHHVEKCDIPFIAMYRKEQCLSLLKDPEQVEAENNDEDEIEKAPRLKWHKVLWEIKELDTKWLLLQKRKTGLLSYYKKRHEESCRVYDEARLNMNQQLFISITKSLENAESEREVDDADLKFSLHFPPDEVNVGEGKFKRPKRKSLYSMCIKAGLWEVASKFGCNSEQFGMQITLEKITEALEDLNNSPDEVASNFTCTMFETPQAVLKGARHMAAIEISSEPCLRKYVRSFYMDHAVVSTSPTPGGHTAIDSFHPLAGVKCLCSKPLSKFEDAQWLLIQKAEEEKLLQVTIGLPKIDLDKLTKESNETYLSDGVSKIAQLWNEQRKLILQDAFSKFLLPSMEKEARALLTVRAKKWLRMEYGKQLWKRVSVAPYQRKEHDVGIDEETAPRVMACCWGPGNPETTFVMLDSSGELLGRLHAGSFSLQSKNVDDIQRKKADEQRLLKFMTDHRPHVVVLGAANLFCKRLKEEIYEIIFKTVEENPRDVSQEMDGISIVYGDESLPRLYEHSRISSDQLPGQPGIVKRSVALGRYLQNPLAMIATLCGAGREILSWNIGSSDYHISDDDKYEMVEQVMVDVTNQVGVDINLAASHEWLFAPFQFVSGLGPRKAGSLQRALVRVRAITSRKELTAHGLRTLKVFKNAVGFLRVRGSGMAGCDIDLLDDTRIHPESYGLAKVLAGVVYKKYVEENASDDALELAIEYVRDHPNLLKGFLVKAYANDVKKKKIETLYDIKMELLHGFQDWRTPYQEMSADEEFYMMSGENADSLVEGKIVQATVRRVQTDRAICVLESGLTGILYINDFANQLDNSDLTVEIQEGDILNCKIRQIQKNRYRVVLTCKEIELKSSKCQNSCKVDPYYSEDLRHVLGQPQRSRKEEFARRNYRPRMIVHPHFQNMTADEAIEFLSDKDVGQAIIRPSSRGPYLTLTLKMFDGVYAHKDIIEGGKDQKDITSLLHLGTTLQIGDENFEDLDEVMDRYVDPLVAHLKAMLGYRKFRRGSKAEVDDILKVEKSNYPTRIVYCFGICYEHPGAFILSYMSNTNPHHEYIGLYPKGFKFRKHMFDNIDRLVAYFQKHINDLHREPPPSVQSVAAVVRMRSPAYKNSPIGAPIGSGWESNDAFWRGQSNSNRDTSTLGSRGRNDDVSCGQGGHPSGLPRAYGGCGRDPHSSSINNNNDNRRKAGVTIDNGWNTYPVAKILNLPGREAFPGGWSDSAKNNASGGSWGSDDSSGGQSIRSLAGSATGGHESYNKGSNTGDNGWSNFPGRKVLNSPGQEAFPRGWGNSGGGSVGGKNWDSAGGDTGGWVGSSGGGNWGSARGCVNAGGSNWGGHSGHGCGSDSFKRSDYSSYNASKWDSNARDGDGGGDGWSSFPGAKVQNSPGREAFPGGWGSSGSGAHSTGGWVASTGGGSADWGSWSDRISNDGRGCRSGGANDSGWAGGKVSKGSNSWGDKSSSGEQGRNITAGDSTSWGNWGDRTSNDGQGSDGRAGPSHNSWANVKESKGSSSWGDKSSACKEGRNATGGSRGGVSNDGWGGGKSGISACDSGWVGAGAGAGAGKDGKGSGGWKDKSSASEEGGHGTAHDGWVGGGKDGWGNKSTGWAGVGSKNSEGNGGWGDKTRGGWGDANRGSVGQSRSNTGTASDRGGVSNDGWGGGKSGGAANVRSHGGGKDEKGNDSWGDKSIGGSGSGSWGTGGQNGGKNGKGNVDCGDKRNSGWGGGSWGSGGQSVSDTGTTRDRSVGGSGGGSWGTGGQNGDKNGQGNVDCGDKRNGSWGGGSWGSGGQSVSDTGTTRDRGGESNYGWGDGRNGGVASGCGKDVKGNSGGWGGGIWGRGRSGSNRGNGANWGGAREGGIISAACGSGNDGKGSGGWGHKSSAR